MANITWNGTTGFWNIGGNWIGGIVPTSADVAFINGGTVTNNAAANISSVAINNASTLASSANLTVTSSIGVGASGSGRADLNVSGGTVSAGTSVVIGAVAGNNGLVSVFNTGVLQANTIAVGSASTGTLSIFNGGTVAATAGFTVGSGATLGTINIGETSLAGTINGNIAFGNAGSRIIFNSSNTAFYAGNISGAGSVTVNSPGQSAIFTGTSTYSGATTITAGTLQIGNGGTTGSLGSGGVTIGAGATLAFQHSASQHNYTNVISGAGNVAHRGGISAVEVLEGNNSYTGTTTIDTGTLLIGGFGTSGSLGTGNVILINDGALDFTRSDTQVIANNISGAGYARVYGNHTAVLTGANSYSGLSVIYDGANTLQVGDGGTTGSLGSSAVSIGTGGTLAFQHGAGSFTNANVISGAGSVVQRGTGSTEVLTGNNSYAGTTTIDSGTTIQIGNGGASGTLGSGSVTNNGTLAFNRSTDSVVAGVISGTGGLVKDGGGDIYLTAANSYSGTTTINAGRINIGDTGGNGTTGSLGTGAVILSGTAELNYFRSNDATIANAISGTGGFTKSGPGILTLTGADTHSGFTQILGGTLRGGGINVFSASALVNIATGARLDVGGFAQSIGGLVGSGIVENSGSATFPRLTLNVSGANTFSGVIRDGAGLLGLTKTGAGTQTLSGVNIYTRDTVVNAGTLALTGSGSIAGLVQVDNTARFDISVISGASTAVRDVLINTGGQIILGGKTLNVIGAIANAGAGAFVGSAATDAVVFTAASTNFTLAGASGATFTNWTDGIDSITINGNANGNTLTGDEIQATTINGGGGADVITGGAGDDVLRGDAGADTLDGAGGTNTLAGGADDDTYIVTQGNVTINEVLGEGIDLVRTNKSSFFLSANVENLTYTGVTAFFGVGNILDNVITGGVAVDQLEGRDGNDTLNDGVGSAADALFGGVGNDIYIVNNRGSSTLELTGQGTDEVRTTFFIYALQANIENLTYTDNAQHGAGIGNALDNVIAGGTGVDDLFGRAGNDTLRGGSGAANTVLGQEGDDIYIVEAVGDSVIEFAGDGTDTVQTALSIYTLRENVENLTYTGAATFTGVGATGANTITGGALDDFLSGLDGADILVGKSDADLLIGGTGADQFRYEGGESGFDRITDFLSGTDKIALRDAGFAQTATIALAQGGTPVATTTNSTFLYNVNNGILSFDADGTGAGAAVMLAQLNAGLTLAPGDFLFY